MRYNEVEFTVQTGDDGTDCLFNECKSYWYLTYGRKYWLLVNWDQDEDKTVTFTTLDLSAVWGSLSTVTAATLVITAALVMT